MRINKFLCGVMLASIFVLPAFATGINLYFYDNSVKDLAGANITGLHPYQSGLEFLYNNNPLGQDPRNSAGKLAIDTQSQYTKVGPEDKYQLASQNGGTMYVRAWKGTANTENSFYGVTSSPVASGTTLPIDFKVAGLITNFKAAKPYAPSISQVTEVLKRVGDTYELTLTVPVVGGDTGEDGKREITGYRVVVTKPDNTSIDTGYDASSTKSFTKLVTGTYKLQPVVKNWFGETAGPEISWTTLSGGGTGLTVYLYPSVEVTFVKKDQGYGINTVSFPFTPVYSNNINIDYLDKLINTINVAAGGEKIVTTFGFWDRDSQQMIGWVFNDDGTIKSKKGTNTEPKDWPLKAHVGYQIYVKKSVGPVVFKSSQ
ncbi:hypothetical protein A2311_00360 [candidate division WOR-1 bacterium RIFOXYB2_FULL_48_7]|uniref:Uncharacterized protein n=1 Tax=candidate division WOR-1 bacterium RIFOXYB2_FULL_48_7 TaxID=1802583 RepID=A0A1F4TRE8_UNCSA|nr:MAG: hypothetical protein A2311_00360 [candidate division WOR-1 bacterium RIFOXYB2_FULL_48_7]